jgi:hypothetical protein
MVNWELGSDSLFCAIPLCHFFLKGAIIPQLSLFPDEDILTKKIESWKRYDCQPNPQSWPFSSQDKELVASTNS